MSKRGRQHARGPTQQQPVQKQAHPAHRGTPVRVGPYEVYLGGTIYLKEQDFDDVDVLIPLTDTEFPLAFGQTYTILAAPLVDFGGVPENWEDFLREKVIPLLESGNRILAFCVGGHGRTGTFLASLIALLESEEETPDPVAAARERYCQKAVEVLAQAKGIFALRGQEVPEDVVEQFTAHPGWGKLASLVQG